MENNNKQRVPLYDKVVPYKNGAYVLKTLVSINQPAAVLCQSCGKPVVFKLPQAGLMGVKCRHCGTLTYVKAKAPQEQPAGEAAAQQPAKPAAQPAKPIAKPKEKEEPTKTQVVGRRGNRSPGLLTWGNIFRRKKFELKEGTYVIGRKDGNCHSDIELNDKEVSRRSVVIEVTHKEDGYYFKMTVKKATNPVLHNNQPLGESESILLNYGDSIQLGRTVINFSKLK